MKKILSNQAVKKFMHNRKAVLGLIIVCFLVLAVILMPIFMKLDPYTTDRAVGFNKAPCPGHLLGTDDVGRDLFARKNFSVCRDHVYDHFGFNWNSVRADRRLFQRNCRNGHHACRRCIYVIPDDGPDPCSRCGVRTVDPYGHGGDRSPRLDCNRKADLRKCVIDPGT